jgi:Flp pilus assembly protein TadD
MFRLSSILVAALFFSGCALPATFAKDIAPLVFEHCAPCHHPGGIGPFPLLTYDDVSRHAAQIVAVTRSRYMPPWPPAHTSLPFAGDRSLTPAQIQLFADWVTEKKPEGAPADLPPAPRFNSEWQMGPPDLILKMAAPFHLPASGGDLFRNFVLPSTVTRARYVRGFELRLDNPRVVHHANIVIDRTQSLRRRDGSDGQPGFPGMDVITEAAANNFDPDSHFLFWKPGSVLRPEQPSMSWVLDPRTDLILNLHLQPTGKPESILAEVGLYFTDQAPTQFPMLVQLEHDGAIHIPPGSKTFTVTDSLTLPTDADLLAVYPHAHYLGKNIEAWATLPNGSRITLIHIPDWDINWQAVYDYATPLSLPKGTRLEMRVTYDNSAANPRNPNHPPRLVLTGNRSQDEMGHVWFQLLPKTTRGTDAPDPRMALQEAVMRRRLEKYGPDFLAYYNLAALLQTEGKTSEAADLYRLAIKLDPRSATAHNSLAADLLMQQDVPNAIKELRIALECDATYTSAHYNLARALAASGSLAEAESEYKAVLKAQPDDAGAHAGLGTLEFKRHDYQAALGHFRAAAAADPTDADVQTNLGTVLAVRGELKEAEHAFEEALRLDPTQESARNNLALVRAKLQK